MILNYKRKLFSGFSLLILVGLTVWVTPVLAAEYVYISDNLRVGVRIDPVSGVPPISVVTTGMRLQVQESKEGYVKIRTEKGVEGWVKDIYVTKKAPAIIQLNRLQAKYTALEKNLQLQQDSASVIEKANISLNNQLDVLKEEKREWQRERASILVSQYSDSSWLWFVLVLVMLLASFLIGAVWYRTQAMKRLGGLRV